MSNSDNEFAASESKRRSEYVLAVKDNRLKATHTLKDDPKKKVSEFRLVLLECGDIIDCEEFISKEVRERDDGYRRKVHPNHFASNKKISDEMALDRCTFLRLAVPLRYIELAEKELKKDRTQALDYITEIIDAIVEKEAAVRDLKWGENRELKVISSTQLGKALSRCATLQDAKPIWEVIYPGISDLGKNFREKLGIAAMTRIAVVYDPAVMKTHGKTRPCFTKLASNTINDIRKKISRYGGRGEYGIVINKKGPRKLSAEDHEKKRSKWVSTYELNIVTYINRT